jgi:hypothetical protein
VDPPLKSSALYSRKVKSRPKSVGKASKVSSSSKSNKTDSVASSLPIVVGKIYRKVENFDLEELSVNFILFYFFRFYCRVLNASDLIFEQSRKIGRDEYVPLPEVSVFNIYIYFYESLLECLYIIKIICQLSYIRCSWRTSRAYISDICNY